jgi:hypothetical protein
MTQQQFIEEIKRLPVAERITLLEILLRSVREDIKAKGSALLSASEAGTTIQHAGREQRLAAVYRLRGILKPEGKPLTDEEVKAAYAEYLMEKYS